MPRRAASSQVRGGGTVLPPVPPVAPGSPSYRSPSLFHPPRLDAPVETHLDYVGSWAVFGTESGIGLAISRVVLRLMGIGFSFLAVGVAALLIGILSPFVYGFCHLMGWVPPY